MDNLDLKDYTSEFDELQPDSTKNLSVIANNQATDLDLARSGYSGDYLMDGTEITIYENSGVVPWICYGGSINWTGLQNGGGEDTTIKGYWKNEPGGGYVEFYTETFLGAALPSPLGVPFPRESNTQCTPSQFVNTYGVKFTADQAGVGGGWNTLPVEINDAKPGG